MAYIGMRSPKFWPISTRTDGSAITYGNPVDIGPGVRADVSFDVSDNPDYGDDVIIDNDKGINGYTIALETNDVDLAARGSVLGWTAKMSTATTPALEYYDVTGAEPPEGGFSFIRVKMFRGTRKYEAFFFHALQFSDGGESASTQQKQITWNHPTLNATGIGCYLDSTGVVKFFRYMQFDSESAATTWLNSMGGYTPPVNNG